MDDNTIPWFRQRWPWLVMLPPIAAVIAGISTVIIANTNPDSLVVDDFQKIGLVANRITARDRAARELGLAASVSIDRETGLVLVRVDGDIDADALRLDLHHPTQPDFDVSTRLAAAGDDLFRGNIGELGSHRWYLAIEDAAGAWRLTGELKADESLLTLNAIR